MEQIELLPQATSPLPAQGGSLANASGKAIEDMLATFLGQQGYWVKQQELVGRNIYGGRLLADLYLPSLPLAIEVKWQDRRGSIDRVFPYVVENCRKAYPCPVVIVADGAGISPGALGWLRGQVDGRKLIGVYSLPEFFSWALRGVRV